MHCDLWDMFLRSVDIIKDDPRCLGGWHFGSVGRGLDDEYSDVDPVFLIDGKYFDAFDKDIPDIFDRVCDKIILIWPEEFMGNRGLPKYRSSEDID